MNRREQNDRDDSGEGCDTGEPSYANYHSFSDPKAVPSNDFGSNDYDPLANTNVHVVEHESRIRSTMDTHTSHTATQYRGFSTSISDLFRDPTQERVDCCSITLCGIIQNDRDRYLLTGMTPPSAMKRIVMHLVLPLSLFFTAGMCALHIQNVAINQLVSTALILLMVLYIVLQCGKGRTKRIDIRKDLLFTKYQRLQCDELGLDRHTRLEDGDRDSYSYYQGQTRRDMTGAHPCCLIGCYAEDRPISEVTPNHDENLSRCLYESLCPSLCGMHCQLCGICAIAQEARDMEICVLPRNYSRVDYITMEHVSCYYPAIYQHRHQERNNNSLPESTVLSHRHRTVVLRQPLSLLSYKLLQCLMWLIVAMLLWCLVGPYYWKYVAGQRGTPHMFHVNHLILLLLTFGQAFGCVWLWHYMVNQPKSCELSMDAIIKYFASGFFLSGSLALFWELVITLVIDTFITLLLAAFGVDVMDDPETNSGDNSTTLWFMLHNVSRSMSMVRRSGSPTLLAKSFSEADVTGRPDYAQVFGLDHPVFYTVYIFIATFFVAAFTEEICKYFGFCMVEHPDFFSRQEIEEVTSSTHHHHTVIDDDNDHEEEVDDNHEEAQLSQNVTVSSPLESYLKQSTSVQARGAAITMAMVSTAIGFACCENLLYVFCYAGQSFQLQLGVLLERSFFPVHPILAAIQSIGVCRRDLEASRKDKLGRIIIPAVIIHGSFDFLIVFISFIGKLVGQQYNEGDLRVSNTFELFSVIACVGVMVGSIFYLYNESRKQRERLVAIDNQTTIDRSNLV